MFWKVLFLALFSLSLLSCAHVKEATTTIGHTTRDATKAIGHATRDTTREIGHWTRDKVNDVGDAITK